MRVQKKSSAPSPSAPLLVKGGQQRLVALSTSSMSTVTPTSAAAESPSMPAWSENGSPAGMLRMSSAPDLRGSGLTPQKNRQNFVQATSNTTSTLPLARPSSQGAMRKRPVTELPSVTEADASMLRTGKSNQLGQKSTKTIYHVHHIHEHHHYHKTVYVKSTANGSKVGLQPLAH